MKRSIVQLLAFALFTTTLFSQVALWNVYNTPFESQTNNIAASSYSPFVSAIPSLSNGSGMGQVMTGYNHILYISASSAPTLDNAISLNHYIEFTIQPISGYEANITDINIYASRSPTVSARYIALFSSINGFNSSNVIQTPISITSTDSSTPQKISFSGLSDTFTNSVSYRLYFYGSNAAAGWTNMALLGSSVMSSTPSIEVNGSVSALPEASAALYLVVAFIVFAGFIAIKKQLFGNTKNRNA